MAFAGHVTSTETGLPAAMRSDGGFALGVAGLFCYVFGEPYACEVLPTARRLDEGWGPHCVSGCATEAA